MRGTVTILMYHYVRNIARSRYSIKGLDLALFRGQLEYVKRHYTVITAQQLLASAQQGVWDLPQNALLLTFDDGYLDHWLNVFPLLNEYGFQGSFFPPARTVCEGMVLDVNKIHFILASVKDKSEIVRVIYDGLNANRAVFGLESNDHYYRKFSRESRRFDVPEVVFIKSMLQRELPVALREKFVDELFQKYVTSDERAFAAELYMNSAQLQCMLRNGMYVGSHGYSHQWLGHLSVEEQTTDVDLSIAFLKTLGVDTAAWVMCYPYGNSNATLHTILKERGCVVGLTTMPELAGPNHNPFLLPRLDTNDLPANGDAAPNDWTKRSMGCPAN